MMNERVAIITPSYRNDVDLAADLCRSIDKFVRFPFEHVLVVPTSDLALFDALRGSNRRILSRDSILKRHGFYKLPLPTVVKVPFGKPIRIREQYYKRGIGRLSGWLVQQIVKLSAAEFTNASTFIFADSDAVLVRDFHFETLLSGGRPKIQRHLRGLENAMHHRWRAMAHRLIGVDSPTGEHFNYIGQLIPWDREILKGLLARIQTVSGKPWRDVVAEARDVSEYILYGEYAAELSEPSRRPVFDDMKLYVSVWWPEEDAEGEALVAELLPQTVAVHIQSTYPISVEKRRTVLNAVQVAAGAQPAVR